MPGLQLEESKKTWQKYKASLPKSPNSSPQSAPTPKSVTAPKSTPTPKSGPKSAPTPQSPPKSAPAPQFPPKSAPTSKPKKKRSLFPKVSLPKSSSSTSSPRSSPISLPSAPSSPKSPKPCFPKEPRKLGNLNPLQHFSSVTSAWTVTWLPRKKGSSRPSTPVKDEDHQECWLRGGVMKKTKFLMCNPVVSQVRCSTYRFSSQASLSAYRKVELIR